LRLKLEHIGLRGGAVGQQAVGVNLRSDARLGLALTNIGQFARHAQIVARLGQLQREAARLEQIAGHLCGQALQRSVIGESGGGQVGIGSLTRGIAAAEQVHLPRG